MILHTLSAHHWSPFLTCFFGELCEGLDSLLSIAAFRGNGGDVSPPQGSDNVHHGLGLEWVWRNHPREKVIAPVVTQLRGCWRIADLRDLEEEWWVWREEGNGYSCVGAILVQHHRWLPWWLFWQITFLNGHDQNHSLFTTQCTVILFVYLMWNLWNIYQHSAWKNSDIQTKQFL